MSHVTYMNVSCHTYEKSPVAYMNESRHTYECECEIYVTRHVTRVTHRKRGGGLGSRPKKMYGKRFGDGVEYHLMSPTPRR